MEQRRTWIQKQVEHSRVSSANSFGPWQGLAFTQVCQYFEMKLVALVRNSININVEYARVLELNMNFGENEAGACCFLVIYQAGARKLALAPLLTDSSITTPCAIAFLRPV